MSSLLSSAVRAQLPLDATEQIVNWDQEKEEKKSSGGYVQLHFHTEGSVQKGKIMPENKPPNRDTGKTKFGYSTVVFEAEKKERDLEYAEQRRQNKPPPPTPPKYESSSAAAMPKHSSDSKLYHTDVDYSKIDFSKKPTPRGISSPDLKQSLMANGGDVAEEESPYVISVRNEGPPVPPRRGVAAIMDESPPFPTRR